MIGMINRGRIKDMAVVQEFEHLIARLRGFLSQSFDADGNVIPFPEQPGVNPVGTVIDKAGDTVPDGWVPCDGRALSRAKHLALFAEIGTDFGAGDGSTTFNVPDCQGRFRLGKAASGTGSVVGSTGGSIDHTHTGPSHTHSVASGGSHSHTVDDHDHTISSDGGHDHGAATGSNGSHTHTGTVDAQTDGQTAPVPGGVQAFSASNPNHVHGFTTDSDGAHTHSISSGGAHDHGGETSGSTPGTDSQGAHDHGGATGAGGTGNTGTANPPYIVLSQVLIFSGVNADA